MSLTSKLYLPNGVRRGFTFRNYRFWTEDGQVCWEDQNTGAYGAMLPTRALAVAKQLYDGMYGENLESSACRDHQDRKELREFLTQVEQLAKDELKNQPDVRSLL